MAITFITEPQQLTPAFNKVVFTVDSTNKNKEAFRYVVDVYLSGTATKIHETRIAPRIGDGYGIIPLEKILQAYVSFTLDLTNTTSLDAPNSFVEFDLKVGEEYVEAWEYDDYEFRSGNKTALNSTLVHTFQVGDAIEVKQDDPTIKPQLEGLFIVTEVPNSTEIVIDIDWNNVGSGATVGGAVRYADNRTTITRDLATKTKAAFNGALSFVDFKSYLDTDYKLTGTSTSRKLLTDLPARGFYMSEGGLMFINFGQAEDATVISAKFQNDSGTVFTKSITGGAAKWVRQFAAGAGNMGDSGTIVNGSTKYFDFWLADDSGNQLTQKYRVTIDRRCIISETEFLFMDRKGSFIPFAFALREYESGEISREVYAQELGEVSGGAYTYDLEDTGEIITSVNLSKSWKFTANWLNDEMSILYEQLLSSPVVLAKIGGNWLRVTVQENAFNVDRIKNKKAIKKSVTVKLANETNINA